MSRVKYKNIGVLQALCDIPHKLYLTPKTQAPAISTFARICLLPLERDVGKTNGCKRLFEKC